jgi:hypothetical protein
MKTQKTEAAYISHCTTCEEGKDDNLTLKDHWQNLVLFEVQNVA